MRLPRLAMIGLIALPLVPSIAGELAAQAVPCGKRTDLLKHLLADFKEEPVAMGLDAEGRVLEILAAPTGTWTILITNPAGLTCLVTTGTIWQAVQRQAQDPST
jgi:hypothetical protein